MARSASVAGANFKRAVASAYLPTVEDMLGYYLLGTDFATSAVNHIGTGPDLTVLDGAPTVYGPGYVECDSGNTTPMGFNTGIVAPMDVTMFAIVSNKNGTGRCPPLATTGSGFLGFLNTASNLMQFYNSQTGTATSSADLPFAASNSYYFFAGRGAFGGLGQIFKGNGTGLDSNTAEVAHAPATNPRQTRALSIGTNDIGQGSGVSRISVVGLWSRLLTDAQILDLYLKQKALAALRGITVL